MSDNDEFCGMCGCTPCQCDDDEDEDYDAAEECGRWRNGKLDIQCSLAGTEWCDWECPIGLRAMRGSW